MGPLAIIPILQAAYGAFQTARGEVKANKLERPTRTTSQSAMEAAALAKYGATAGQRPGSGTARQGIATTQAGTVSAAGKAGGSSAQTMATALGAQQQANQATRQQDVMDAQYRQHMNTQYLRQLQGLAREEAANWQWNEAQKFQEEAAAARGLQESGVQNVFSGLNEYAGMDYLKQMGYFNMDNGGGQAQQPTIDMIQGQTRANYAGAQQAVQGMQMPANQYQAGQLPGANPLGLPVNPFQYMDLNNPYN